MHLATQRVISSIPRGETDANHGDGDSPTAVPSQQHTEAPHRWQYPSEQQFYNAMLKKGHRPPVESIPSVLQIHNAVNERSWSQVCRWERDLHDNAAPTLVRFVGRPTDLSPKAWWNSRVCRTQEPFDRHDWFVEDVAGGEPRRYVIDFYEGEGKAGDLAATLASRNVPAKPPSMYIDVRPALDSPSAAVDRMTMLAREALPGLAGAWDSYKASVPTKSSSAASVAGSDGINNEEGSRKNSLAS